MLKPFVPDDADEPVPPQCRATVDLIQRVLDGDANADSFDADAHPAACPTCRERVRAARVLLSVLAVPPEPVVIPSGLTDNILGAVQADRRVRSRQRVLATVGGFAVAAALLVGVWFIVNGSGAPKPNDPQPKEVVQQPTEIAPAPREKSNPAPEPRPIRIGDGLKSGLALFDTPKPIADSAVIAPKLFEALAGPFTKPTTPVAADLEPARRSLVELPSATRAGLEPVTGTAEKALGRFLRDMGSVQPKPN